MLEYITPQWHRLVVIIITAVLIGFLFSLSFATIIPLLKVMMGEEGLRGWVDRKICNIRYGMDFYVPDSIDYSADTQDNYSHHLLVVSVDEEKKAYKAGIRENDRIVGAGKSMPGPQGPVSASWILEYLATTKAGQTAPLLVRRFENGKLIPVEIKLEVPEDVSLTAGMQNLVGFVPRETTRQTKQKAVVFIILLMGAVTIVRCFATFIQKYMSEKVVQIACSSLREDTFEHALNMPAGFFVSSGTSDTVSRIVRDIAEAGKGYKVLLGKTLREPLKAIGMLTIAMFISWKLTLVFLGLAPVTIGLLSILGKKIKKATRRSLESWSTMLSRLQNIMAALRVVKVYNRQDHEAGVYKVINRKLLKRVLRIAKVESITGPVMDVLGMVAGSTALIIGAHWVFSSNLQASSFFGLLVLLGASAESIRKVSDVWNKLQQANAAAERVYHVIDYPPEIEKQGAVEIHPVKDSIEFRDLTFTYPGAEKPVLDGLNLKLNAGQTVAIVGPNGSGKTTLVNLLPRFYDVDSGAVLFDGVDIASATLRSLRSQISMVTQNVVTFNDTIAANISYGKPEATMEEIIEAAKMSYAHEFIEPLPAGYETMIGEQGAGLSGGQLQRIVIARAILKDPAILIFDEAMSQVDADSETKIHKALEKIMKGRTCFMIAHRFSTVKSADTIVVMDAGRIIAQGTHEQLIENCQLYKNLYETQLM